MLFSIPTEKIIEKEQRQIFLRRLFRRVFLEDWGTKLIALGITITLWLGVTGLRPPTTVRLRRVTLNTRVSNDMEITSNPVQEVEILVTGDKRKTDKLNERDLIISVDLTDVKQGDQTVQLTPDTVNLELPSGLKLDEVIPSKIPIRLEKVEEREVEVKPDIEGTVADGFEIYSINVVPAKVRVRGAESFVKSLESVSTENINVEDRKEGFVAPQIGLSVFNPKITVLDAIVDVNVRIGEKRMERLITVPFQIHSEAATNTAPQTKKASVLLYGPRSLIEKLTPESLKVEMQKSETGEEVPHLILPAELQDKIDVRRIKLS